MKAQTGPIAYMTMGQTPPWTLDSYQKVGGYEALRKIIEMKMTSEQHGCQRQKDVGG